MITSTAISPTDKIVFISKKKIKLRMQYEASENEAFCMYWQAYSRKTSKHCGQWNRWVHNFDHHWKWLNNWIGESNYCHFIFLLISNLVTHLFTLIIALIFIITYHIKNEEIVSKLNLWLFYDIREDSKLYSVSYGASVILLIFSFSKICFSIFLLSFQVFVRSKGLTTYKYVMLKRNKKLK